ncbi:MAG: c-type cytochrome [Pseudomonadota bacterium]
MWRLAQAAMAFCILMGDAMAQEFTTLKGHGGPIMALAVTDDDTVISGSFDNALGMWSDRTPTWLDGHAAAVTSLTAAPSGRVVSGGDDFAVLLWQNGTARELGRHKGKVMSIAISPDERIAVSGSWDGTVAFWPMEGGAPEMIKIGNAVNAVAYSADGSALFVGTSKGVVWRYDLGTDQAPQPLVKHGFAVNRIAVAEKWIAYGAVDGGTRIIDAGTGAQVADFTLDRRPILALSYHAETQRLAVGDGEGYIMIVDTEKMRIAQDFRATRQGPIWALAFSNDGKRIWAGGVDDVVYGWPVALLSEMDTVAGQTRSFLQDPETMSNGERQFMRKCSICHALDAGPSRRAGPTLHRVFGRKAGSLPGYVYSDMLPYTQIVWGEETIDALFDKGPDHYIPGSKMPMQVISKAADRADLIEFLKQNTRGE